MGRKNGLCKNGICGGANGRRYWWRWCCCWRRGRPVAGGRCDGGRDPVRAGFRGHYPGDGVVEFTLLGRVGQLPYARWGQELAKGILRRCRGTGRLLLWGGTALWALWGRENSAICGRLWH